MPKKLEEHALKDIIFIAIFLFKPLVHAQTQMRAVRPEVVATGLRDVRQGPDGLLSVLTDSPQGKLIRLLPE